MFNRNSPYWSAKNPAHSASAHSRDTPPKKTLRRKLTMLSMLSLLLTASMVAVPAVADASTPDSWLHHKSKPTVNYVALGDSFSAGQGSQASAADFIAASGSCLRYRTAYPNRFAARTPLKLKFTSVACSGAKVLDFAATQAGAFDATTNLISLTLGGNDAGFVDVATACVLQTNCQAYIAASGAYIARVLPLQLAGLYQGVQAKAPNAKLVVLGYPDLFGTGRCTNVRALVSAPVRAQLDGLTDLLDNVIEKAAVATGATYVDVRRAFAGHGVCGMTPWINGMGPDLNSVLHPNAAGADGYSDAFAQAVATLNVGVPPRLSNGERETRVHGFVGRPFSASFAAEQGSTPLLYSVQAGSLPPGLTFDSRTGKISGTPTTAGRYRVTVAVTNVFATASHAVAFVIS